MSRRMHTMYLTVIGTLLLVIVLLRTFTPDAKPKPCPCDCPDYEAPVSRVDTTWEKIDTTVRSKGPIVPSKISKPKPGAVLPPKHILQNDSITVIQPSDTPAVHQDFYSQYIYERSFDVPYGKGTITDTVSRNTITGSSGLKITQDIPRIKETVILHPKRKAQWYAGIGLMGQPDQPLREVGPELTLVTRSNQMYSIGVYKGDYKGVAYKAGIHFKIKLKRDVQ